MRLTKCWKAFKKQPVLPDGLFTQFMPSRRQILFGTLSDGGSVSSIRLRLFGLLGDKRCAHGFRLFDIGATGGLSGHQIAGRHSSDDPDLTIAFHPEALSPCRKSSFVDATTRTVTLVENEPLVCSHAPNCTDDSYSPSILAANRLFLFKLAPRHGFEPRFTAPKAAVLPLDDRGKRRQTTAPLSLTQPAILPRTRRG